MMGLKNALFSQKQIYQLTQNRGLTTEEEIYKLILQFTIDR